MQINHSKYSRWRQIKDTKSVYMNNLEKKCMFLWILVPLRCSCRLWEWFRFPIRWNFVFERMILFNLYSILNLKDLVSRECYVGSVMCLCLFWATLKIIFDIKQTHNAAHTQGWLHKDRKGYSYTTRGRDLTGKNRHIKLLNTGTGICWYHKNTSPPPPPFFCFT